MKKTRWFIASLLAVALVFGGCSSDSDDDDDSSAQTEQTSSSSTTSSTTSASDSDSDTTSSSSSTSESTETSTSDSSTTTDSSSSSSSQSAYLPDEFKSKTVSALYTYTSTKTNEITNTVTTYVLAFYFFSDNGFVTTYRTSGTGCIAKGTYTHTGDFENDTISTSRTHRWNDDTSAWIASADTDTITVTNGSFKDDVFTYTKQ